MLIGKIHQEWKKLMMEERSYGQGLKEARKMVSKPRTHIKAARTQKCSVNVG